MKTVNYSLTEIRPNIFHLEFKDSYDLCMYFLRYQEFYESSSPKFRNKSFSILSFMRWYSKKYGNGSFTYPTDWNGFNFPGNIIQQVYNLNIPDRNIYDYEMLNIYRHCKLVSANFYLIGTIKNNKITLNHEIAHGFFYLDKEYKSAMIKLVQSIPQSLKKQITSWLKSKGYTPKVYFDEIQAYLSTGFDFNLSKSQTNKLTTISSVFIRTFNEYDKNMQGSKTV